MPTSVEFELLLLNNSPEESFVILSPGDTPGGLDRHKAYSFVAGLREILLAAFRDMAELRIWRMSGMGLLVVSKKDARSLADVVAIDDEDMEIETERGYKTFLSYTRKDIERIDYAMMLLVWKYSGVDAHFDYGAFPGRFRLCVCCGKMQWGKPTGQHIGGKEIYSWPSDHCFNPQCFSHVIEHMIDPSYTFVPPKPGEDFETDMEKELAKGGKGIDPAVKSFLRDMT